MNNGNIVTLYVAVALLIGGVLLMMLAMAWYSGVLFFGKFGTRSARQSLGAVLASVAFLLLALAFVLLDVLACTVLAVVLAMGAFACAVPRVRYATHRWLNNTTRPKGNNGGARIPAPPQHPPASHDVT